MAERTAKEAPRGTSVLVDLRKAARRPALYREQSEEKSYLFFNYANRIITVLVL